MPPVGDRGAPVKLLDCAAGVNTEVFILEEGVAVDGVALVLPVRFVKDILKADLDIAVAGESRDLQPRLIDLGTSAPPELDIGLEGYGVRKGDVRRQDHLVDSKTAVRVATTTDLVLGLDKLKLQLSAKLDLPPPKGDERIRRSHGDT